MSKKNKRAEKKSAAPLQRPSTLVAQLTAARKRYAIEWSAGNAQTFAMQGLYKWMANFLRDCDRVLEVGAGDGSSTAALLSRGRAVVSIEENPACLDLAERKLRRSYPSLVVEKRGQITAHAGGYTIRYTHPKGAIPGAGGLLLEGDIFNDPTFAEWCIAQGGFDALCCWLMGTYQERTHNGAVSGLAIKDPADYRDRVHQRLMHLGHEFLKPGALLHVVDRCLLVPDFEGNAPGSPAWLKAVETFYIQMAAGSRFVLSSLEMTRYREPPANEAQAIRLTRSMTGHDPDQHEKAFISVIYSNTGNK